MHAWRPALALSLKTAGNPLFDHWIDIEGAVNVIETYLGARLLAPVNDYAKRALTVSGRSSPASRRSRPQA